MSNAISDHQSFRQIAQQTAVTLGLEKDYEYEQLDYFANALREADRFLDVGANRGLYARLANRVLRNSYIALVEANPELAEMLRRDVATWPNENNNKIEVFAVAAGDMSTRLSFFMDERDDLGMIAAKPSESAEAKYVQVQCEPLDRLFAPADRTLIKIDVEGFEYRVVLGAKRLLAASPRVMLELHGWGDGKRFPVHVLWLMYTLGFAMSQIGRSYTCEFVRAGFFPRSLALLRWGPILVMKYLIRRAGLRPFVYSVLWPDHVARAGK